MDLTSENWMRDTAAWLVEAHSPALTWSLAYTIGKLSLRMVFDSRLVSGRVGLAHHLFSVAVACWTLYRWPAELGRGTCGCTATGNLSDETALVILLQVSHSCSDLLVFWPELIKDSTLVFHHGVLIFFSLILPQCPGCFFVVITVGVAELGSGAIAWDAEWRKTGRTSRGLTRVILFGIACLVNLILLYQIWLVTPTVHEFVMKDSSDGSLVFKVNVPICMIASVGGSLMMFCMNGFTWWRMWSTYLKQKENRALAEMDNKSD